MLIGPACLPNRSLAEKRGLRSSQALQRRDLISRIVKDGVLRFCFFASFSEGMRESFRYRAGFTWVTSTRTYIVNQCQAGRYTCTLIFVTESRLLRGNILFLLLQESRTACGHVMPRLAVIWGADYLARQFKTLISTVESSPLARSSSSSISDRLNEQEIPVDDLGVSLAHLLILCTKLARCLQLRPFRYIIKDRKGK